MNAITTFYTKSYNLSIPKFGQNSYLKPLQRDTIQFGRTMSSPPQPIEHMALLYPRLDKFWEGSSISNPAVTRLDDGNILMLYRANGFHTPETAIGLNYLTPTKRPIPRAYATLGLAILDPNGREILQRSDDPILSPPEHHLKKFPNGFEDPRITKIDDTYYITATGMNLDESTASKRANGLDLSKDVKGHYIYLIETKDFKAFKFHGQISPDIYDKNGFFHSEKVLIDGKPHFLFFHRLKTSIQVATVESLSKLQDKDFWRQEISNRDARTILSAKFPWEGYSPTKIRKSTWPGQVGGAAAPIKFYFNLKTKKYIPSKAVQNTPQQDVQEGWLFIYNSAGPPADGKAQGRKIGYCVLSIPKTNSSTDGLPLSVIARSPQPLLEPKTETELNGLYGEPVVFSCGYIPSKDGKYLDVFYGSGDRAISKSRFSMEEICNYVLQFDP